MQRYTAHQFVQFHAGRVALTAEQAARRRMCTRATGEPGVYEITAPCGFKLGESFGYDGDVPKAMHAFVAPASDDFTHEITHNGPLGDMTITDAPADAVSTTDDEGATEPNVAAPRKRGRLRKS